MIIYPHSPNSLFEPRNATHRLQHEKELEEERARKMDEVPFEIPKKFSSNFHKLVREKTKSTLTPTKNKFHALTDDSDSDLEDEIWKIVKQMQKRY